MCKQTSFSVHTLPVNRLMLRSVVQLLHVLWVFFFFFFFLSTESAALTFSIQPFNFQVLLWLEYCSVEIPTAGQWSPIQMKMLYIWWSSYVPFVCLKVKASLCTLCSCHVQYKKSLSVSAAVDEYSLKLVCIIRASRVSNSCTRLILKAQHFHSCHSHNTFFFNLWHYCSPFLMTEKLLLVDTWKFPLHVSFITSMLWIKLNHSYYPNF